MSYVELFILAVALSMDAFAVSVCKGLATGQVSMKHATIAGGWFGGFQALMPLVGWALGVQFQNLITSLDHWIAFFVFWVLGIKIISEAFKDCNCEIPKTSKVLSLKILLMIGLATSIDAFVSGAMLYFIKAPIWSSALIIGVVTFVNACIGFNLCRMFKNFPMKYLEIFSGLILILLGTKVLVEHLAA